jgi:hypothetical protein
MRGGLRSPLGMAAAVGSVATASPFSAPTLEPTTRSRRMPAPKSARSIPTSAEQRTPPAPSTNAVVVATKATFSDTDSWKPRRGPSSRARGHHVQREWDQRKG